LLVLSWTIVCFRFYATVRSLLANLDGSAGITTSSYSELFPGILGWAGDRNRTFSVASGTDILHAYGASSKAAHLEYPDMSRVRVSHAAHELVDLTAGSTILCNIDQASSFDSCFVHPATAGAGAGAGAGAEIEFAQCKMDQRLSRGLKPTDREALTMKMLLAEDAKVNDSAHKKWCSSIGAHSTLLVFSNKPFEGFEQIRAAIATREAKRGFVPKEDDDQLPWPLGVLLVCQNNWRDSVPAVFHHRGLFGGIEVPPCKCSPGAMHCKRCMCARVKRPCDPTDCKCRGRCANAKSSLGASKA
jgi:hypothetical protein